MSAATARYDVQAEAARRAPALRDADRIAFEGDGLALKICTAWRAEYVRRAGQFYRRTPAEADAHLVASIATAVAQALGR